MSGPAGVEREWRYERKYPQDALSPAEVELIIRRHPALFVVDYPERWVNSLYYDTAALGGLADSVNGLRDRVKIRVRWYGALHGPVDAPVMEFKRKRGRLGTKDRYELAPFDFTRGTVPLPTELAGRPPLPEDVRRALELTRPASLTRYRRVYFRSADRRFRLTLDADLALYRVLPGSRRIVRVPDTFAGTVIEVKYGAADDEAARPVLEALPFRWARFSKYCAAYDGP